MTAMPAAGRRAGGSGSAAQRARSAKGRPSAAAKLPKQKPSPSGKPKNGQNNKTRPDGAPKAAPAPVNVAIEPAVAATVALTPAMAGQAARAAAAKSMPAGTPAVVFDTNALLLPFTSGTRLHEEIDRLVGQAQWLVPSSVSWELERLGKGKDATARAARMALRLVSQAARVETSLPGDDGVLAVATANRACVATNDRTLQNEAARRGLRVIVARAGGRLAFMGGGSSV